VETNEGNENNQPSKIAKLQHATLWIKEQILRFNVSVAYAQRMNVGKCPAKLIHVQLHVQRKRREVRLTKEVIE
jgi:hypothetical protein